MSVCRLCGEEKSHLDFNVELSDIKASDWNYRELIEYHTRVALKPNKLLPQGICEDCRKLVDCFEEFSKKVQSIQSEFDIDHADEDHLLTESISESIPAPVDLIPEAGIKEQEDSEASGSEIEQVIAKVIFTDSHR
jgi:Zinc-finger associated domain (zf-AD)